MGGDSGSVGVDGGIDGGSVGVDGGSVEMSEEVFGVDGGNI